MMLALYIFEISSTFSESTCASELLVERLGFYILSAHHLFEVVFKSKTDPPYLPKLSNKLQQGYIYFYRNCYDYYGFFTFKSKKLF